MKKILWQDIPESASRQKFTRRNSTMRDLNTGEIIQYYSTNTKIEVSQKAVIDGKLYYRTASARDRNLDWGFEASTFDGPKGLAPSEHFDSPSRTHTPGRNAPSLKKKQTETQKGDSPKDGEGMKPSFSVKVRQRLRGIFRR